MIKYDGYGKLLKQSFFSLLISCFILLGSSYVKADGYTVSLNSVNQNGSYVQSIFDSNLELAVYSRGMLSTSKLGTTKRILAFQSFAGSTSQRRRYFWWNDGIPYYYFFSSLDGNTRAFSFDYYGLCDSVLTGGSSSVSNCVSSSVSSNFQTTFEGFFNSITSSDYWGYSYSDTALYPFNICFSSSSYGKTLCFRTSDGGTNITMDANLDFADFPNSLLGDPPGRSTSGGGNNGGGSSINNSGIPLSSDESALNYYEKHYGRDESICYAGVNSLSYLYGQNGVAFQEGQGLSIFEIFEQLYGNTDLDKIYVWLNSRLINYENWFDPYRDEPSYLANYNSGTNQVDIYYDNLTFPFANQPVAFYFLASNITSQSERNTMGSSVVSYCNIKINSGSFDEIIDQSQKNNITNYTEKSNTNIGLNPDGTPIQYTGAFLGTGVELAFSGNTSIKNTLKNFFDQFDRVFSSMDINTNNRILPTWLVSAFIFVVLFKFLRKK